MMTSSRPRDTGESFASRRGHVNQLSISDPSHHVTEAIGTLYGDSDDDSTLESRRDSRPLSFIASPYGGEQIQKSPLPRLLSQHQVSQRSEEINHNQQKRLSWTMPDNSASTTPMAVPNRNSGIKKDQPLPTRVSSHDKSSHYERPSPQIQAMSALSPTVPLHDVQPDSPSASQFPLTNIDNPNDIAQELSNLQALRRMSMDVGNTADPDMVPFQGLALMAMPSIAPTGVDDEGDISRLLWVPAKVHPELAPDQFKNFLENRVQSMKRRSAESSLTVEGLQLNSSDSLRRKKSMLSRQVESSVGDHAPDNRDQDMDGTMGGRLQRQLSHTDGKHAVPELSLNELVKDPGKVVQKLTMDTQRQIDSVFEKSSLEDDRPILPVPTMGLRRSTRTTYRKGGSLRSGDRLLSSRRTVMRPTDKDGERDVEESGQSSSSEFAGHTLPRVQSESPASETISPPERSSRRLLVQPQITEEFASPASDIIDPLNDAVSSPDACSPAIAEIPQPSLPIEPAAHQSSRLFPQRSSSQNNSQNNSRPNLTHSKTLAHTQTPEEHQEQPPPRSSNRSLFSWSTQQSSPPTTTDSAATATKSGQNSTQAATDISQYPSHVSSRTDSLTFIPTLSIDDRKSDKKTKDRDENEGGKSTGWKWFKSEDREKKRREKDKDKEKEKDKEKDKERERERDEQKKTRGRVLGERSQTDKAHDGARLDVLQSSIDNANPKGRDSIVLDRDNIDSKFHEERKKESGRKSSDTKKEKDGFFGSIFGGSRRKESKDSTSGSKGKPRPASPENQAPLLRPDIDYPYTRFPIVQERAIYRMAHIKLANPRRDLRSQVVISNLMYDYLSKVQAMHPQLNVPTSPQQKRQDEERKRREQELQQQQYLEQQMLVQQQQSQSNVDQYNFDYHRATSQYGDWPQHEDDNGNVDYIDDAQIFEYAHDDRHGTDSFPSVSGQQEQEHRNDSSDRDNRPRGYYDYSTSDETQRNDDMW